MPLKLQAMVYCVPALYYRKSLNSDSWNVMVQVLQANNDRMLDFAPVADDVHEALGRHLPIWGLPGLRP